MTYEQNKQMQLAWQQMMCAPDANYFVTLAFNKPISHSMAKKLLGHWQAHVDKRRLGKKWARKGLDERLSFLAVPEHVDSNYHYHLVATVPTECDVFEAWATAEWEKVTRGVGTLEFERITTHEDRIRVASYSTKDAWKSNRNENIVISTEFSTKK